MLTTWIVQKGQNELLYNNFIYIKSHRDVIRCQNCGCYYGLCLVMGFKFLLLCVWNILYTAGVPYYQFSYALGT